MFTLTEKDSAKIRYGICLNFLQSYEKTRAVSTDDKNIVYSNRSHKRLINHRSCNGFDKRKEMVIKIIYGTNYLVLAGQKMLIFSWLILKHPEITPVLSAVTILRRFSGNILWKSRRNRP